MDARLSENLSGKHGSYMLPFLWLHGESKERLYGEIIAIKNSGIREFCAESRTYERFCEEQWWDDFGFILKTAKELDMNVWLLDDKHYPTGYANGYPRMPEYAHLQKKHIREKQIEAVGPMKKAKFLVGGFVDKSNERILKVIAYRHDGEGEHLDYTSAVDLTSTLNDGTVYWDIPSGIWRLCVTIETGDTMPQSARKYGYIDMLNPESCRLLIKAVYEPQYEHFKEYFGSTFMGFFSDEPGFLNREGTYQDKTGIIGEIYPWRADLPKLISDSSGLSVAEVELYLPALWEDIGDITSSIRMHYMDVISKLYRDNFGNMIGNWCRERGIMYIGHVIEDNGAHMRMAYGAGHFFRSLEGQDMAGIDVVLMQDIPGISDGAHRAPLSEGGLVEPEFFRYTMPKMAASLSHIQPLKKGRAMCDIFSAFGWAAGLPFMKGLADIMLASGINYFVPHAFSPKEEDPDCPPHFYNGGKNIQYPLFKDLMNYMGRCSHLLIGGIHRADVAVFYNAEGEWSGGKNQIFHKICKDLTNNLIDFDVVPYDALINATVSNGKLLINGEDYGALIISESEIFPISRLKCFENLAKAGLPVIFTDSLPERSSENENIDSLLPSFVTVKTKELCAYLRNRGLCHVSGKGQGLKDLRFYHVSRDGREIYLFSNEGIRSNIDAFMQLCDSGECLIYEPWDNKCYRGFSRDGELRLSIEKGNMLFVIFGDGEHPELPEFSIEADRRSLSLSFDIAVKEEGETEFKVIVETSELFDISAPDRFPRFSGWIRYRTSLELLDGYSVLDLGEVGEVAEVTLNGKYLGSRICAPYKFDLSSAAREGKNELEIIVTGNLAHRRRDKFSKFLQLPPTGIMGDIALCKYE